MNGAWVVKVPLLRDELFSTWLARAALAQGCDPMVLTGSIWPGWRAWTRDLDRGLSDEHLDLLAANSGLEKHALEAATLRPVVCAIAPRAAGSNCAWPWVMALGSRNRRRFGGLQYCPECLGEDELPYFRRAWRLAWHVGCEKHGCLLGDHCSHCKAPVEPHLCRAVDQVLSRCPGCGHDLREGRTVAACADALAFQRAADLVLQARDGIWAGTRVEAERWFAMASRHAGGRIRLLPGDAAPSALTSLPTVLQRPSERVLRLQMAYRAMQGGLQASVLAMRCVASSRSRSRGAPGRPPTPRPRATVNGEWIRLLRRLRLGQP